MANYSETERTRRRNLLKALAGVAATAPLAGFSSKLTAAEAKELRILFPGGNYKEWFDEAIVMPFSKKRDTRIIWKTGLGFEPLIIAQRSRPQWDLAHLNQPKAIQLGALDAIVEWKPENIPNLEKIHPAFRYPNLAGKTHTPYGLAVNTKRIKKPITSWLDLWDPEFIGKVAFPEWIWMGEEVFHAINLIEGGDAQNIDPGIAKMQDLFKQNKAIITSNAEHTKQLLLTGEAWICPYFGARVEQTNEQGGSVEFILPQEGGLSWIWNTAIISGRPNASIELAEQLVNDSLGVEGQLAFSRSSGYPPTNMELMNNLPADLKKHEFNEEQLELLTKLQRRFDYMAQFANRDRNRERWNKEVLGA